VRVQRRYNPEGISRYNIVPGLMGVVLTMIMMTALAMTRERERGNMENLLATPLRPIEVMIGKIAPFIIVGYIQVVLILLAAKLIFGVPSLLLSGFTFPFRGMPSWAQTIGKVLPLTHFLRIVRGILLKGKGASEIAPELWPIGLFMLFAGAVALRRYRQTLD
jgi:ABC-2 type transport system permease protein